MKDSLFNTDYDVLDACFLELNDEKSKDLYFDDRVPGQGKIDLFKIKSLDEEFKYLKRKYQ